MNCLNVTIERIQGLSVSVDRIEGLSANAKHACGILEAGPADFNFSYDFNIDCSIGISIDE